jgi:hypothetical protein
MSGSSPAGYTTSTQTATPGGSSIDYMNQGLGFGGNLYNQGSTHAFLNGDQTSGLNEIARIANSGNQTANQWYDFDQGFTGGKYLNSNIANPGLQQLAGNSMNTQGYQNNLTGLGASAMNNPANPYLNNFSRAGATGSTQDMLGKAARGDYLSPDSNPWLKSTFDQGFGQVQNSVGSAMAGAGRFGSGAMAGALGSGATNLANDIYGANYQQERTRQQQAQQLIGQLQSSDRGQQQAAAEALGQLHNTGVGLGISANADAGQLASGDRSAVQAALGQLSGNYNAGLDATTRMAQLSPALNEARYADMAHLLQAGQGFQQDQQAGMSEPWSRLGDYMNLARGMPTTSTQTTNNPYFNNPTGNALSALGGTSGALSALFGGSGALGMGPSLASQLGLGTAASKAWSSLSNLFGGGGGGVNNYVNSFTDPMGTGTGGNLSASAFSDLYTDPATGQKLF